MSGLWATHAPADPDHTCGCSSEVLDGELVTTPASKRILLFELDQMFPGDNQIYDEVAKRQATFPGLVKIDEIWFANNAIYETEKWASSAKPYQETSVRGQRFPLENTASGH